METFVFCFDGEHIVNNVCENATLGDVLKEIYGDDASIADVTKTSEPMSPDMTMRPFEGIYVSARVRKFCCHPDNREFVEFLVHRKHEDAFGVCYTPNGRQCTFCCDEEKHVFMFKGKPIIVSQGLFLPYVLSLGSNPCCMISKSNLDMIIREMIPDAKCCGLDVSKVKFP